MQIPDLERAQVTRPSGQRDPLPDEDEESDARDEQSPVQFDGRHRLNA